MSRSSDAKQPDFNNMSFDDFDQKSYGVRKLAAIGDFEGAGKAIESYISVNDKKLTPAQRCLLWFHAGQNAAHANEHAKAIAFFEKASETVSDEKSPDKRKYALAEFVGPATEFYLKASIAFISNQMNPDRTNTRIMREALDEILKISILDYPPSTGNAVTLPGRVKDMCQAPSGTTYHDIFEMNPSLPPLPGESSWHVLPKNDPREGELVRQYRNKLNGLDVDDDEMTNSAFGQGSNATKKFGR